MTAAAPTCSDNTSEIPLDILEDSIALDSFKPFRTGIYLPHVASPARIDHPSGARPPYPLIPFDTTVTSTKMFLGQQAGTVGALPVTDPGSNIIGANSFYADAIVGNAGNGRINAALGGQITNQHFWTLGNAPGSDSH